MIVSPLHGPNKRTPIACFKQVMTSGWGLRCSNDFNSGCSQPDVLQGIESDTTILCPVDAVVEPSKFCVNAPSGKASCNVSAMKLTPIKDSTRPYARFD